LKDEDIFMNSRSNKEKNDLKALDEMIEEIIVGAYGDHERGGLILRAVQGHPESESTSTCSSRPSKRP
jgi:hypothetical protein